jgi:putative Holliday junction resolvase
MMAERLDSPSDGSILALDLGEKLVGAAISDNQRITIKRLAPLQRSNWKRLLSEVETLIERFDAQSLVIGLPLRLDGTIGSAAEEATRLARNFAKSLKVPVYLQDERLTSFDARLALLNEGHKEAEIAGLVDGESAAIILRDFLQNTAPQRIEVEDLAS